MLGAVQYNQYSNDILGAVQYNHSRLTGVVTLGVAQCNHSLLVGRLGLGSYFFVEMLLLYFLNLPDDKNTWISFFL